MAKLALTLFGVAFVGTFAWIASPEAAVALMASRQKWSPLVLGLVAASGQAAAQALLFGFGAQLRRRWRWFDRRCARVHARHGQRLERNATVLALSSGLLGLPPTSVTATLAPGLIPRPGRVLPLMFAARVIRFALVAALASTLSFSWP